MRIGIIYKDDLPANAHYRVGIPMEELARRKHDVVWGTQSRGGVLNRDLLLSCDVVHIYRRADPEVMDLVDRLVERRIGVTWDNDDDLTLLPVESPQYKTTGGAAGRLDFRAQRRIMRRVHVVTTTNQHLAERYRSNGAGEVEVVKNFLGPDAYARPVGGGRGELVIGWVAALEHRADVGRVKLVESLTQVLERHPSARVVTVGVRLGLPPDRYEHVAMVPFDQLPGQLRQWDIGIAPLSDIPMSYARSDVKVKEYAACGVPWIASARGPYAGLGPDQGGLVVEDGGWIDALDRVLGSGKERRRLRRSAERWAKSQSIREMGSAWEHVLQHAIARAGSRFVAT